MNTEEFINVLKMLSRKEDDKYASAKTSLKNKMENLNKETLIKIKEHTIFEILLFYAETFYYEDSFKHYKHRSDYDFLIHQKDVQIDGLRLLYNSLEEKIKELD